MGKGGGILRAEWGMAVKNRQTKIGKACTEMGFLELKDGLGILMVLQLDDGERRERGGYLNVGVFRIRTVLKLEEGI